MYKQLYSDYNKYLESQKEKTLGHLSNKKIMCSDRKLVNRFFNRNLHLKTINSAGKVLCLGARSGVEVEAFIKLGYDAIGIDLIECKPYVIVMDMMNMKFDYKFDIIYTNSIDHCFDIIKFIEQIKNNLNDNGIVVIDFIHNKHCGVGGYEAVNLGTTPDLIQYFINANFILLKCFSDLPKRYSRRSMLEDQLIFKRK
jgi:SAM-dependent methyltransferase